MHAEPHLHNPWSSEDCRHEGLAADDPDPQVRSEIWQIFGVREEKWKRVECVAISRGDSPLDTKLAMCKPCKENLDK